jgi:predicted transcriptional regulator
MRIRLLHKISHFFTKLSRIGSESIDIELDQEAVEALLQIAMKTGKSVDHIIEEAIINEIKDIKRKKVTI